VVVAELIAFERSEEQSERGRDVVAPMLGDEAVRVNENETHGVKV
jgi:hypothetical protein